jgi:hypothetical protein
MTNFEVVVQYYFPGQEEFILPEMAPCLVAEVISLYMTIATL